MSKKGAKKMASQARWVLLALPIACICYLLVTKKEGKKIKAAIAFCIP